MQTEEAALVHLIAPLPYRRTLAARGAKPYADAMSTEMSATDRRRRRLLFRATHRGTKENDLLIGGFVAAGLAGFSDAELDAIEAVMELPDTDLAEWLTGRHPIPREADSPILRAMCDHALGTSGR